MELDMLREEFPAVMSYFNELNAENVEKERAQRVLEFAESKTQSRKLINKLSDARTKKDTLENTMSGL
jgi:hypothetical protein